MHCDKAWDLKSGATNKASKYRLSDNYLRFYTKYVQPNYDKIIANQFDAHSMSSLPGWASIMGLQIENLVLNNRHRIRQLLGIHPDELINEGPFFQRKTTRQKGCQIDYLIQTKHGNLYVCEIKFSLGIIPPNTIADVQEKIERLALPKNFSARPVLIHIGDLHGEIIDGQYFANIIDLASLLDESSNYRRI